MHGDSGNFNRYQALRSILKENKVIQIGVIRDNRMRMCEDLNLIGSQEFTSIDINYDIENMENITDYNIENKMKEIAKLIITWSGRNITPIGKIAIIKSLLISKSTHILFSLPTPSDDTITSLENLIKNFIWKNKPPKFRLDILEATYRAGGLIMTNLKTSDTALKVSWLKRLKNEDDGWEEFPRTFNIHKIILFGDRYHVHLLKLTKNKFWRDVINASKMLLKRLANIETNASNIPIWFISGINIVYRKTWLQKGYTWVSDILDINGDLLLNEELLNKGLYLNFLDYERFKYDIS